MKLILLFVALIFAVACGKKNESGKSETKNWESAPYSIDQEEEFRQDFIQTGKNLIYTYREQMTFMFGAQRVGLMKNRLRFDNVQVTEQIVMNDRNEVVRSFQRHGIIYLYIGQGNLDWIRAKRGGQARYHKLVLHEMLELADINDSDFRYSDQILGRR